MSVDDDSSSSDATPEVPTGPDVDRRTVLKAIGATGAAAAIGTPTLAQDNTTDGDYYDGCPGCGPTDADLSDIYDPIIYNSGKTFSWLSPWHSLGGEDAANEEYEYQQRLAIYNQAYNWMQFTERQLTGVENQGDLYSRSAMEDGLVELFYQAQDGAVSSDAITAAKDVVRDEWDSIFRQFTQHFEQTVIATKKWHDHLFTLSTDLEDSTSRSYTMVTYDPFTGDVFALGDNADGYYDEPLGSEDYYSDLSADYYIDDQLTPDGSPRSYEMIGFRDNGGTGEYGLWLSLPPFWSDLSMSISDLENKYDNDDGLEPEAAAVYDHLQSSEWTYDEWDPETGAGETYSTPVHTSDESLLMTSLRIMPPDPQDFAVDPEQVEDVSDHPNAYILTLPVWHETLTHLMDLYQESMNGVETWANSNYTDVKNNPDQWSLDDMVGPSALQESAQEATNPAEAALGLHGQGVPTNLDNDVLIEFPNATDSDGNVLQAPGYLAMLNPPSDGLPVGEVIDPTSSEFDGSTIYFAFWNSDLAALPGVEDDGGNVSDGNVTNESDDLDGDQPDDYGTYKPIGEPFKIIKTAEGTDAVTFEARDVSDPAYDWETVVENLQEQNQALQDANEKTITVINESDGGPVIPGSDGWPPSWLPDWVPDLSAIPGWAWLGGLVLLLLGVAKSIVGAYIPFID